MPSPDKSCFSECGQVPKASYRESRFSGPNPCKWTEGPSRQQSSTACGFQTMCLPIIPQHALHSWGKLLEICSADLKNPSVYPRRLSGNMCELAHVAAIGGKTHIHESA